MAMDRRRRLQDALDRQAEVRENRNENSFKFCNETEHSRQLQCIMGMDVVKIMKTLSSSYKVMKRTEKMNEQIHSLQSF